MSAPRLLKTALNLPAVRSTCQLPCWTLVLFSLIITGRISFSSSSNQSSIDVDENGYIAYCPCMGRFGNQADQFLGVLAFAKRINRTLILPPWIEYVPYQAGSNQISFDTYFKVEPLAAYHRVITMEVFMEELAPTIWPPSKRIAFCHSGRGGGTKSCEAKDGNPFGPFWDHFNIDFIDSELFGPNLHYINYPNYKRLESEGVEATWEVKYPGKQWPVLAFVGPPAAFPVEEENAPLQQYLIRSDTILEEAQQFIKTKLPKGPFIGIHIRNGIDWTRACELVSSNNHHQQEQLFSSPQCIGYVRKGGPPKHPLTYEICFPPTTTILKQVKRAVKRLNATSVFVASDKHLLLQELTKSLAALNVKVVKLDKESPHLDLSILGLSNHFIGNCVSSFTAFVKRERDVQGFKSEFWAYPPPPPQKAAARSQPPLGSQQEDVDVDVERGDNSDKSRSGHEEL